MAEDFLGVSAHFDVSEIVTGFNTLIELLEKAGVVTKETADKMTASLTDMQSSLSEGLTSEGLEKLSVELDNIKGKVAETMNAFSEGTRTLGWGEISQMVETYNRITAEALHSTQAAYEAESEKVRELNSELQKLVSQKEDLQELGEYDTGLDDEISRITQELKSGVELLDRYASQINTLSEVNKEAASLSESIRMINESANVDVSEVLGSFNNLIEKLKEAGKISEETSGQITDALTAIQDALNNELSASGIEQLNTSLDTLRNKVVEAMEGYASGTNDMKWGEITQMVIQYQNVVQTAHEKAQEAYQREANNVDKLRTEIEKLSEERQKAVSSGATLDEISKMNAAINSLFVPLRDAEERENAFGLSVQQTSEKLKEANTIIEGFTEEAPKLSSAWKELGHNLGELITGGDRFEKSLKGFKDGFNLLPDPVNKTAQAIAKMGKAMLDMIKTPIGWFFAAIILALQGLFTWFNKSAEGQKAYAKISAFLGSILESITDILVKLGSALYHCFVDAKGPMHAFAVDMINWLYNGLVSVYHEASAVYNILAALFDLGKNLFSLNFTKNLENIGNAIGHIKTAGSEFAQGMSSATKAMYWGGSALMDGINGAKTLWDKKGDQNLLTAAAGWTKNAIGNAITSMQLAERQLEADKQITENRKEQAEYESRIAAARRDAQAATSKEELQKAMRELRQNTGNEYYDQIKQQEKEVQLLEEQSKLHTQSLKDETALKAARLKLYMLQKKRELSLSALDALEAKHEKRIDRTSEKEKKAEERKEKAAKREKERLKKKEEREAKAAKRAEEREKKKEEREAKAAKRKEEREKKLAAKEQERISKAAAKLSKDIDDYAYKSAKERVEAEERVEEARLKALKEGASKRYALRQHEHEKELAEIDQRTNDRIKKEIDAQKKLWEERNKTLKKGEEPEPFVLNSKPIEDIRAQGQKEKEYTIQGWDVERLKELTEKYQDYYDQRLAAEEQFNEEIGELQAMRNAAAERKEWDEVERITRMIANAEKKKGEKLVEISVAEIKARPENLEAYDDLGKTTAATIIRLVEEFKKARDAAEKAGHPVKEIDAEIKKLQEQLVKNAPFVAMIQAAQDAKIANEELEKAKKVLEDVQNGSPVIKGFNILPGRKIKIDWMTEADAQKNVTDATNKYADATKKAMDASKSAIDVIDGLRTSFESLGKAIGGDIGDIMGFIGSVTGLATKGLSSILDGAKKVTDAENGLFEAMKSGDKDLIDGAKWEKRAANANMWMAAMSTMVSIIGAVQGALTTPEGWYQHYADKQKEINNLRRAVEEYRLSVLLSQQAENGWFAKSGLTSLTDAYEKHGAVVEAYYAKLYEAQEKYHNKSAGIAKALPYIAAVGAVVASVVTFGAAGIGALAALGAAAGAATAAAAGTIAGVVTAATQTIASKYTYKQGQVSAKDNLRMQTQHKTWFRGEKTQNLSEWTKENLNAELFDKDGLINLEAAQQILDRYGDKLVGETKETLEDLINLRKQYNEFMEQVEKYVSDLYSPLVDDMTDALFKWLQNGTDVLWQFRQNAKDTFAAVGKDMVKQMMIDSIFAPYSEDLKKIYATYAAMGKGKRSNEYLINSVMTATDAFLESAEEAIPALQEAMTKINDQFAERGFDLAESSDEDTGAYKAAQSFSQEQGDELNGRLTAIQIGQQQGVVQRAQLVELQNLTFGAVVQITGALLVTGKDISAMRDMQYSSLQRLTEISVFTSVLPAMAADISDMRTDIRTKL